MADQTGVCVYCGTERASSVELCPTCGRGWIDERVATSPDASTEAPRTTGRALSDVITTGAGDTTSTGSAMVVDAIGEPQVANPDDSGAAPPPAEPASDGEDLTDQPTELMAPPMPPPVSATAETRIHEDPPAARPQSPPMAQPAAATEEPPPPPPSPVRWWVPVGIAVLVLAVYAVIFAVLLSRTGEETATPVVTTTTAAPTTTTVEPTTTTTPPTSTTSTTTTTTSTTTTTTTLAPIPASGEAVALGDLRLGASQLGPLRFGDDEDAAGVLVATFGQPDTYFPIGEDIGLCPTETGRAVVWGPLTAIFRDEAGTEVLVGYVLDGAATSARAHPAEQLRTLSGIGLGDTTRDIDNAYGRVSYEPVDGSDAFLVLSSEDGRTLVWGLLSDADPAEVRSIASPRACDGGPFATS